MLSKSIVHVAILVQKCNKRKSSMYNWYKSNLMLSNNLYCSFLTGPPIEQIENRGITVVLICMNHNIREY